MYASHKAELDCVAVDVVAKTLIVAGWKCAMDNEKIDSEKESNEILNDSQLSIYNCASQHNMDLDLLVYHGQYLVREYPFERFVWLPGGGVTLCKTMNYFRVSFIFAFVRISSRKIRNENSELHSECLWVIKEI